MADDYEVGYGRPPKSGQFAKGQSGNPQGRPKGSKNIGTMFNQMARKVIIVKENGKTKTITQMEAVLCQMTNRALSGDLRAMKDYINLARHFEEAENNEPQVTEPSERDRAVLESIRRRMERIGRGGEENSPERDETTAAHDENKGDSGDGPED